MPPGVTPVPRGVASDSGRRHVVQGRAHPLADPSHAVPSDAAAAGGQHKTHPRQPGVSGPYQVLRGAPGSRCVGDGHYPVGEPLQGKQGLYHLVMQVGRQKPRREMRLRAHLLLVAPDVHQMAALTILLPCISIMLE